MTDAHLSLPVVISTHRRPVRAWLDARTPQIRHSLRRLLVVLCLLPLVGILAREAPRLSRDPIVLGYGMTVLAGTVAMLFIAYARYDDPAERTLLRRPRRLSGFPVLGRTPSVTLLVAVKDEAATIVKCVESMANSDYQDLEVIVVDDGSTDGTTRILRDLNERLDFTLIV